MSRFAELLSAIEGDFVGARQGKPRGPLKPQPDREWQVHDIVRRSDDRVDPTAGIRPRCTAAPRFPLEDCPYCGGVGAVFEHRRMDGTRVEDATTEKAPVYEVAVDCACADLRALASSYTRAQLPAGYHDVSIDRTDWSHPGARKMRQVIDEMSSRWRPGDRGLVLCGANGVGKGHAAALICTAIATRPRRRYEPDRAPRRAVVCHVTWPGLLQEIKTNFDRRSEEEVVAPYLGADLLWLDELGMGQRTEWVIRVAEETLWGRLNLGKTTIITSNLPPVPEEAPRDWPQQRGYLCDHIGFRVMSRLQRACDFFWLDGEDYRLWQRDAELRSARGGGVGARQRDDAAPHRRPNPQPDARAISARERSTKGSADEHRRHPDDARHRAPGDHRPC